MSKALTSNCIWAGVAGLLFAPLVGAQAVFPFDSQLTLSDPCAVFNAPTTDPNITRITYGEDVAFDVKGHSQAVIDVDSNGRVNLKFQISSHGDGVGDTSGIKYLFNSKALVKSNAGGYDPLGLDPLDPDFVFNGRFKLSARMIGQGSAGDVGGIAQGAQDNALLQFYVNVRYANGEIRSATSDFTLQCVASPWANLMKSPNVATKKAVGRGFGDVWNKYAWSMKSFNGGMVVGTKNAFYDILANLNPSGDIEACINSDPPIYQVTDIHESLACSELFAAPAYSGLSPSSADTRYAEIWRFDYVKKSWTRVREQEPSVGDKSEGFRYMETHNGKLYVGSDLGAFITGVDLYSGTPNNWNFPGSRLLVSSDGKTFEDVPSCVTSGPCTSRNGVSSPYGIYFDPVLPGLVAVNTSIRAMASYKGELYVGTFNALGAELWAYNDVTGAWRLVKKFANLPSGLPAPYPAVLPKPAVAELRVAGTTLYIGLAGPAGMNYLYRYNGFVNNVETAVERVPGQPLLPLATNVGTLKLFTTSKGLLYIGNVDLDVGFYLQVYDPTTGLFREISDNGFFNPNNAYAWSMAEINGRMFVGTFNQDFLSNLPRGEAELWYSDDSTNWQQMALPLDWGLWNYGIRTMEVGNKMLFLGAASNMVAPDLITKPVPLSPGTEVWTIRATAVAPTGKIK